MLKKIGITKNEKQIENEILEYLSHRDDVVCWKNENVGIYDPAKRIYRKPWSKFKPKGISDIIGFVCGSGKAIFIEVKAPKGRLTQDQEDFLRNANEAGCISFLARSIEHVEQEFVKHGLGRKTIEENTV